MTVTGSAGSLCLQESNRAIRGWRLDPPRFGSPKRCKMLSYFLLRSILPPFAALIVVLALNSLSRFLAGKDAPRDAMFQYEIR